MANPLSSDLNAMRQSLLPGGLSTIARNINRQNYDLKLFEFGNCYFFNNTTGVKRVDRYSERMSLDLFMTGNRAKHTWNSPKTPADFFYMKSFTEMVLQRTGLDADSLKQAESEKSYFTESLVYLVNGKPVAETGKISPSYLKKFEIEQDVYYSHIDWDYLLEVIKNNAITYREL
ncbi:MAG TPA: phenylalanine--tRNA ligase subunit beta, partial [Bacteroidales bacterium]|nr:phenylalanine--tRNA ligase subunit beta [Bacteroidales bacterium]